jgi:hypothetical protein
VIHATNATLVVTNEIHANSASNVNSAMERAKTRNAAKKKARAVKMPVVHEEDATEIDTEIEIGIEIGIRNDAIGYLLLINLFYLTLTSLFHFVKIIDNQRHSFD